MTNRTYCCSGLSDGLISITKRKELKLQSFKKMIEQFYINLCKIVLKEDFVNLQCLPKRLGYKIMRSIDHQSSIINVLKLYFILLRLWNYNFVQAYKYECFPLPIHVLLCTQWFAEVRTSYLWLLLSTPMYMYMDSCTLACWVVTLIEGCKQYTVTRWLQLTFIGCPYSTPILLPSHSMID